MPQQRRQQPQPADCNAIVSLAENLQLVADQLKTGESGREPDANFDPTAFWDRLASLTKALSVETTKLCLGFTSAPLPGVEEQLHFTGRIQQFVLAIVSTFYSFPKEQGALVRRSIRLGLCQVVSSLQELLVSIATSGLRGLSIEELTSTGEFWSSCDEISNLPRTNATALHLVTKQEHGMALDALKEIKEAQEKQILMDPAEVTADNLGNLIITGDNRNQTETWTEADLVLIGAAQALVKTATFVLKKMMAPLKKDLMSVPEKIASLDDLGELTKKVSPVVDDLVLSLYPPLDLSAVADEAKNLHKALREVLEKCKELGFCSEEEQNWISFLSDAADHNKRKTLDLITARG